MHVITGLPRSGSTLLCNILNQNPKFWATSTSILSQLCGMLVNNWSNSIEVKSDLALDREATEQRLRLSLKGFCDIWHQRNDGREVIFDKSRNWLQYLLMLREFYPNSKVLVMVRDPRNVFSSIEKQHRKTPLLNSVQNPNVKTIVNHADQLFSANGLIGNPICGVEDVIHRKIDVKWIKYEQLVKSPNKVLKEIYQYLEEEPFQHDFDNIENTATDPDAYYNFKFPHKGEGKIRPTPSNEWRLYMPDELANQIIRQFPLYSSFFNYQ